MRVCVCVAHREEAGLVGGDVFSSSARERERDFGKLLHELLRRPSVSVIIGHRGDSVLLLLFDFFSSEAP